MHNNDNIWTSSIRHRTTIEIKWKFFFCRKCRFFNMIIKLCPVFIINAACSYLCICTLVTIPWKASAQKTSQWRSKPLGTPGKQLYFNYPLFINLIIIIKINPGNHYESSIFYGIFSCESLEILAITVALKPICKSHATSHWPQILKIRIHLII